MNKKKLYLLNPSIFILFLSIAVIAEWAGFKSLQDEGYGLAFLLYMPFDMAFPLIVFAVFLICSFKTYSRQDRSKSVNILLSAGMCILWSTIWFFVAFVTVVNVHLKLGGKL